MFLYLGNGIYRKRKNIIGIFDMDSATVCIATRRFLSAVEKDGRIESDGELPKSFLLYDEEKKETGKTGRSLVYLSKLTSGVLISRTGAIKGMTEEDDQG